MSFKSSTPLDLSFDRDIRDVHLIYDYDAEDAEGKPAKWRYEMWFFSENRIVYAIHGGPMAGRRNYQTCVFQCIRPGELWQCNWLEETGSIVSLVYDIKLQQITTLLAFSKGHWENPEQAHGDKRNPADLERWRGLAKIGTQVDRLLMAKKATIVEVFRGKDNNDRLWLTSGGRVKFGPMQGQPYGISSSFAVIANHYYLAHYIWITSFLLILAGRVCIGLPYSQIFTD